MSETPAPTPPAEGLDYSRFCVPEAPNGQALYLMVEGMKCASCAALIETALNGEEGVEARVNLSTRRMALRWQGAPERGNDLVRKAAALGYTFKPFDQALLDNQDEREARGLLRCAVVSGAASGIIMLLAGIPWLFPDVSSPGWMPWAMASISVVTLLYAGQPFFLSAWTALRHGRSNMDVPIAMALVLTTAMSLFEVAHHGEHAYFDSVVMLLFLLLIGRYLDRRTRGRARAAAQDVLALMAGAATVLDDDGRTRLLPVRELQAGMALQVAAGEKIAADGVVESGASEVDPSFITGETVTAPVAPGVAVFGGMVNLLAPITVRLTAASGDSLLGEVIRLMEKAEQGHAQYVRLADRVARYYTPVVLALTLATFLGWTFLAAMAWQSALLIAMTVLIITCPCALGLAVPAVQVLASGRLFRQGMLLKSADALERMAAVDTIVFDKTGTLTLGRPQLVPAGHVDEARMRLAASLAAQSRHPLARALRDAYDGPLLELEVAEIPGQGLEAVVDGATVRLGRRDWCGDIYLPPDDKLELWLDAPNEKPLRFAFVDEVRPDAAETIAVLKQQGFDLQLLSGDRPPAVAAVAKALGLASYRAQVTPVEKGAAIEALRQAGKHVLMVGDGLNDAPALATADVSMSPSSALDIAQNAADIVFQGEKLAPVWEALRVSRRAEWLVKQNFALAFLYNVLAIPVAMAGYVTPLIAAVAMASSSIVVVLNAQRLGRAPSRRP